MSTTLRTTLWINSVASRTSWAGWLLSAQKLLRWCWPLYVNKLIRLRRIFEELAWLQQIPDLVHLLRREDSPRAEKCLPRAFTSLQDQLIQKELLRRNDLPSNRWRPIPIGARRQ